MPHTFVRVRAGDRVSLFRLADVREIVAMMEVDELEGRAGRCRGVVTLRGDVVPVFDATHSDAPLSPERLIVIAPLLEACIGLIVDDVIDVLTVPSESVVRRLVGPERVAELVHLDGVLLPVMEPTDVVVERA